MKNFKRLLPIMGVLLPLSLSATEYKWLTFKMTDNSEVSVAADDLSLNYSDESLHLKSATVDETFAVSNIQTMRFTTSPAGVNDVNVETEEAADYFTTSGVKVGRFNSVEEGRRELPSGIYVVKSATKSLKVIF